MQDDKNDFEPLGFRKNGLECYYSKNKREDSSVKGAVHSALLIDHKGKRFAFLDGIEYLVEAPSSTYFSEINLVSSTAKVKQECRKIIKAGYKNTPVEPEVLDTYRYKADRISKYVLKECSMER